MIEAMDGIPQCLIVSTERNPACSWLLELATGCAAPNVGDLEKVLQRPGVQAIVVARLTDFSFYLAEQWTPLHRVRLKSKPGMQTMVLMHITDNSYYLAEQ